MNYLRTQNNFDKARMITAHIERPTGIAISIPFMALGEAESSTHRESISIGSLMGLNASGSSMPQAITFSVPACIVIHPFSAVIQPTGYSATQEMYQYELTGSLTVANRIFLKGNKGLPVSVSPGCFRNAAGQGGIFEQYGRLSGTLLYGLSIVLEPREGETLRQTGSRLTR